MFCQHENDKSLLVLNGDSFTVCTECGIVVDEVFYLDLPYLPVHCHSKRYQRMFHNNERMALFTQTSPKTPDEAMELLEEEYLEGYRSGKYPKCKYLSSEHINEICKSIKLNKEQQTFFRSKKYLRNYPTNLKKFSERWIEIKSKFVGYKLVEPDPDCVTQLKRYFALLQVPFDTIIYKIKRNNFINYNLIYRVGLELIGYEEYVKFFPLPKGRKQLRVLCEYVWDMFKYLSWPPTATIKKHALTVAQSLPVGHLRFPESDTSHKPAPVLQTGLSGNSH